MGRVGPKRLLIDLYLFIYRPCNSYWRTFDLRSTFYLLCNFSWSECLFFSFVWGLFSGRFFWKNFKFLLTTDVISAVTRIFCFLWKTWYLCDGGIEYSPGSFTSSLVCGMVGSSQQVNQGQDTGEWWVSAETEPFMPGSEWWWETWPPPVWKALKEEKGDDSVRMFPAEGKMHHKPTVISALVLRK